MQLIFEQEGIQGPSLHHNAESTEVGRTRHDRQRPVESLLGAEAAHLGTFDGLL